MHVPAQTSGEKRQQAEEKSHRETDQIEICPGHSRRLPSLARVRCPPRSGCNASSKRSASPGVSRIAPSSRKQRRVSFSRAALIRTSLTWRIAGEALRTLQQPDIELAFRGAQVGHQLGVVALGVIHQKSGMHLEEPGQQGARGLRHVTAHAALDLRNVGLADALALLLADGTDQLLLGHGAAQAAQRAFHFAQVT